MKFPRLPRQIRMYYTLPQKKEAMKHYNRLLVQMGGAAPAAAVALTRDDDPNVFQGLIKF